MFKLTKGEYDFIVDMIRDENPLVQEEKSEKYDKADFLNEVYMTESRYDMLLSVLKNKKNIILQGAPGVGKTFAAKNVVSGETKYLTVDTGKSLHRHQIRRLEMIKTYCGHVFLI